MADIRSYPMARHLRGAATLHVRHLRRGKLAHDGTGLSFFFRPLSAVLSEVPVDDRELPLLFHARTADFQDLAVQASVTFRVTDPATACARIDFSIDPASSGLIVSTGTGATGWCRSAWLERKSTLALPTPAEQRLAWFIREAWPSPATGTAFTEGDLPAGQSLTLTAESDQLVAFGDGIETDAIPLAWGQATRIHLATKTLHLLR